ncbi:MAG: hypothetical protein ACRD5Z_06425, partial [Bryobacteraceae bacterium]
MASSVTVLGAHAQTITVHLDSSANATLASELAGLITAGVESGSLIPATDQHGPPPPLPHGKSG